MPAAVLSQLPHRSPFLLVDRILVREPGVRVVAEKLLSRSDPGVDAGVPAGLLLEMLAQAGGFLEPDSLHGQAIFLAGIQGARFEGTARCGDRLELEVRPDAAFGSLTRVRGDIRCEGQLLCSALLLLKKGMG